MAHTVPACFKLPHLPWHRRRGQSVVEFALVAPFFFLLPFGVIDFGRLFFAYSTVQHAMREAGRFAVTGGTIPDPERPRRALSRVASIRQVALNAGVGVDIRAVKVSSQSGGRDNAGGPGDLVTVSVRCVLPLATPLIGRLFTNGRFAFTSATTFRNEPFSRNVSS